MSRTRSFDRARRLLLPDPIGLARIALRWPRLFIAFVLAALGLSAIGFVAAQSSTARSMAGWWLIDSLRSAEMQLPLVGLAVAIGVTRSWQRVASGLLFSCGLLAALPFRESLASSLAIGGGIGASMNLAEPICFASVGILLILPFRIRRHLLLPLALLCGIVFAAVISLNDWSLGDPVIPYVGAAFGIWIVSVVALALTDLWQPWLAIAAPIVGSWLLAIGVLFGAASTMHQIREPLPQPPPPSPERNSVVSPPITTPWPDDGSSGTLPPLDPDRRQP